MSLPPVVERLANRFFGEPIIRNDLRGELVEEIVVMALEPEWEGCGSDWGSCDVIRPADGLRIQVKQSAAKQTWSVPEEPKPRPCYSIAAKSGRWEGADWIEQSGRNAEIFVFGWHDRLDESADHRDPEQWKFFVIAEKDLPDRKSISHSTLSGIVEPVSFSELLAEVTRVADRFVLSEKRAVTK